MDKIKQLETKVDKITQIKYKKAHSTRKPVITDVVQEFSDLKDFALSQEDNAELVKIHDELVDKVNNFYNVDYLKSNKNREIDIPKIFKGGSEEKNKMETIKISKEGESADILSTNVIEPRKRKETPSVEEPKPSLRGSTPREEEPTKAEPKEEPSVEPPKVEEEDIEEEVKVEEEEMKEPEKEEETHEMPDGTKMTGKTHSEDSVPVVEQIEDVVQENIIIPKQRIGVEGKSAKQLASDIRFFLKKYPSMLKQEASMYKKADKKSIPVLKDIHNRISAILSPIPKTSGKTIGIVLDAEKYLDDKINEILARKTIDSLRPADLVEITNEPKSQGREVGSFAIVKDRSGKPSAERAPVYRAIPSTNELTKQTRKSKISQATIDKNIGKRKVDIAKMDVRNNPFSKEQKSNRFDIVL